MGICGGNCGDCGGCSGCGSSLELSRGEVAFLEKLGQIPFLPLSFTGKNGAPVYGEDRDFSEEEYSLIIQLLEKKGLVSIEHKPLAGSNGQGSVGLTERGQQVLEIIQIQGIQE